MAGTFYGPGAAGVPLYQAVQRHDLATAGTSASDGMAPPGWERSIKRMKKHSDIDNPWALCLAGDTNIPCLDGQERNIRDLADANDEFWVYAFDQDQFMVVPGLARARFSGLKQVCEITLDNKEVIICSQEHKWVLRDGSFIPAFGLKPGMCFMPFKTMYEKSGHERVYQPGLACYVLTHWSVMRLINPGCTGGGYLIHHRNENERDNRPGNLEWVLKKEHAVLHGKKNSQLMRAAWQQKYETDPVFAAEHALRGKVQAQKLWENPEYRARMTKMLREQSAAAGEKAAEIHRAKALMRKAVNDAVSENHVIKKVKMLDKVLPMYDVAVDGYHTFAISAGVFSHNCWWMKRRGAEPAKYDEAADPAFDAALEAAVLLKKTMQLPKEYTAAAKGEVWAQSLLLDPNLPPLVVEYR